MNMLLLTLGLGAIILILGAAGIVWWLRHPRTSPILDSTGVPLKSLPGQPQESRPAVSESGMLKALFADSTSNAMYDLALETGELHWNDTFYKVFGYKPEGIQDTIEWWAAHIHPDDAMLVNDAMDKLLDGTINDWVVNYRFQKADGSYVLVSDRTMVNRDDRGQPMRIFGTLTIQDKEGVLQMPEAPRLREA